MKKELNSAYENICAGKEIRANMITLKNLLKDENCRRAFSYELGGDFSVLVRCLSHEDPKVRKNTALVLGAMECDDLVPVLLNAYRKEDTLFVKSSYLKAIENCEYEREIPYLKERLSELDAMELSEENRKHYREEAGILNQLILKKEKRKKHKFDGYDRRIEVILLTNREQRMIVRNQIKEEKVTLLAGGLRFFTYDLENVQAIRTYREMLFPVEGVRKTQNAPWEAGGELAPLILKQLQSLHEGQAPFAFRIELKTAMPPEKKADWVKNFSAAVEKETGRLLVNDPSNYEVEIRLIEGKDRTWIPLLKLFTLPDERFSYRKEVVASSMAPDKAALLVELAAPWLKEGAQVLDPFCGVGTLLVERAKKMPADPLYGLDIFEEAIIKARTNSEAAGIPIHYINRDMSDFRHDYLFDEIISDLPLTGKGRDPWKLKELYHKLFERTPEFLKKGGMLFLYTSETGIMENCLKEHREMSKIQEFLIQEKNDSRFYVLQYKG